ncbi:MAG: hypothetical protein ACRDZW_00505, partial [Acidimicrobiales bacterium]
VAVEAGTSAGVGATLEEGTAVASLVPSWGVQAQATDPPARAAADIPAIPSKVRRPIDIDAPPTRSDAQRR